MGMGLNHLPHGGRIPWRHADPRGQPGGGTVFRFTLPVQARASRRDVRLCRSDDVDRSNPMLHIVDDEEVIRDALAWLAQSRGMPARAYASGQRFLTRWSDPLRPATATACCSMSACRA